MAMHGIDVRSDVVIKRFRSVDRDQPRREWRALELLDRYAPGLAPAPVSADLDADPPTVVMSRLRGEPVRGPITGRLADAIAEAVTRVQRALPQSVLRRLPARADQAVELLQQVRSSVASAVGGPTVTDRDPTVPGRDPMVADGDPVVADALRQAAKWAAQQGLEELLARPATPVFGTGDGNLANYLWDGTGIRVLDFEYSGRSDLAFELAEVVEHISVWRNDVRGLTAVLERLGPAAGEGGRLTECRRLLALYWLLRIRGETRAGQAERMLALL
ncbi:phosphotransferase family protein [Nonomuraea insulae]|uniref:Phosphotransferase family protein n=1 Tax=Nonomuraea insulae TaxID=1616787 RepID=A0ABW1D918_9ACTN